MNHPYQPTLRIQRELYALPRGRERFDAYLRTMTDARTGDLQLPLSAMNPMAREHVPALLDGLLAMDADDVAARALQAEEGQLRKRATTLRVTLVVADDLKGQWTNRVTTEFSHRFEPLTLLKRGWAAGILWASEEPSIAAVEEEVRMVVHRVDYIERHGPAKTLRQMLAQEGEVMARARAHGLNLSEAEIGVTREIIAPYLDHEDPVKVLTCLFGDAAVDPLGYPPLGLPARAGFALACPRRGGPQAVGARRPPPRASFRQAPQVTKAYAKGQ